MMPSAWDLPSEFFDLRIAKSTNPTINLCDGMKRKATMIGDHCKTVPRKPVYMRNEVLKIEEHISLPNIVAKNLELRVKDAYATSNGFS